MSSDRIHPIDCGCPKCRKAEAGLRAQAGLFVFGIVLFAGGTTTALIALIIAFARARP